MILSLYYLLEGKKRVLHQSVRKNQIYIVYLVAERVTSLLLVG